MPGGRFVPSQLNDMNVDVLVSAPANNDALQYDTASGKWKNKPVVVNFSNTPFVLSLTGGTEQTHVNHGYFWPAVAGYDLGDGFLWEAWIQPQTTAANAYFISDGYGGAHSLLWGFTAVPGALTGNVWGTVAAQSFAGSYIVAAGEWIHIAVLWSKPAGFLYQFVNGVMDGQCIFAGPRTTPTPGGPGVLYVGGSDHLNLAMYIAALRAYDRHYPFSSNTTIGPAFHPERYFGIDSNRSNALGTRQPDLLVDYTVPAHVITDHAPRGCVSGSNYCLPPGTVTPSAVAGGSLSTGQAYFYKVTAVNIAGETTPSAEATLTPSGANLTVGLSWAAVQGAESYNVYRSTTTGTETFLVNVSSNTATTMTYNDTGAVTLLANPPPFANTTGFPTRHPGMLEDLLQTTGASTNQVGPWNLGRWYDPKSSWLIDATCPYSQPVGSAAPAENIPSPGGVPGGALAFDSFGRRNQTWAFQAVPTLGSTEGGSLGVLAWQVSAAGTWGILQGAAVYLGTAANAVAWVPVGTGDQDIKVTNRRGANQIGACGIAFRVQDASNFWFAYTYADPTNNVVYYGYMLAGVMTVVGSFNPGTTWNTLRVLCHTTTITIYTDVTQGVQLTGQTTLQSAQGAGLAGAHQAFYVTSLARNRNFTVLQG